MSSVERLKIAKPGITPIASDTLDRIIVAALRHSDQEIQGLRFFANAFIKAHFAQPGGASLEIGTREGGSAFMFLEILKELYPNELERPMLFTIDPYGSKPYGEAGSGPRLYGADQYIAMKRLLSGYANHAHFYMTSDEFFHIMRERSFYYWQNGTEVMLDYLAFALLDGDHSASVIGDEISECGYLPTAMTCVDNIDVDSNTIVEIRALAMIDNQTLIVDDEGKRAMLMRAGF